MAETVRIYICSSSDICDMLNCIFDTVYHNVASVHTKTIQDFIILSSMYYDCKHVLVDLKRDYW